MKYAENNTSQNYLAEAIFSNSFLRKRSTKETCYSFQKHPTQQCKNSHIGADQCFMYPISNNPQKQLQGQHKNSDSIYNMHSQSPIIFSAGTSSDRYVFSNIQWISQPLICPISSEIHKSFSYPNPLKRHHFLLQAFTIPDQLNT